MNKLYSLTLTLLWPLSASSANFDNGDELHLDNCTGCHTETVYTRAERKVKSLPRLGTQVRFCRDNRGLTWFDDEVADVIHYLNLEYYKF